ncbi:MAG: CCA tRNA nucleotidyltransferase [Phycisphaerales bacterium JB039]
MADPALAQKVATDVARTLQTHGHIAYFAGGCVRDALLGQQPTDFDIATDATPQRVQDLFERTAAVGAHFGVVLVKRRGVTVEVATFRSDGPYGDRRRPDHVTFSDARADAQRRDFTINALFLDPLAEGAARVIDHVGGQADLAGGIIRAVGDPEQRLAEDHLRALRAVRFAARLGFTIDTATRDAIMRHASELAGVSRERIGDEIRRMMADSSRQAAGRLVEQLGLDEPVLGASGRSSGGRLGRLGRSADLGQGLAAWLLDRGAVVEADLEQRVGDLRQRLLLSNEERADLRDTLACYFRLRDRWRTEGVAWRKRLAAASRFLPAVELLSEDDERAVASHIADDVRNLKGTTSGLAPPPLLTGDDLVAAGWRPGPRFGRILEAVYDAQLEDRVATRAEAMELATRLGVEQNRAESSP